MLMTKTWFLSSRAFLQPRQLLGSTLYIHSRTRRFLCLPLVAHWLAVILRLGMDVGAKGLRGLVSQKVGQ